MKLNVITVLLGTLAISKCCVNFKYPSCELITNNYCIVRVKLSTIIKKID